MSTRRIPKGPGRRPKSLERRLFMEMIAKGVSVRAACRELGIARSGAHRWLHGATVILKDGRVKRLEPLDRIIAWKISPRYLSEAERIRIADLLAQGVSASQIARELGRAVSTVSRELRRNAHPTSSYRPFHAHALAAGRRHRPKELKVVTHPELAAVIEGKLRVRWSPAQISRYLRATFPDDRNMHLSHESIYVALYRNKSPLHAALRNSPLRTGRDHRRAHIRRVMPRKRFAQPMLSIHERDFDPTDRSTPGNWEGDLIIGKGQRSAIGTLVERKFRYVKLLHLGWRDSTSLHEAIVRSMNSLPPQLRLSLTWDQGTEMAQHQEISRDTNMKVYFCDPASPWQRPSNENTNGLLRQYFPQGTDLSTAPQTSLELKMNSTTGHASCSGTQPQSNFSPKC